MVKLARGLSRLFRIEPAVERLLQPAGDGTSAQPVAAHEGHDTYKVTLKAPFMSNWCGTQ